MARRCNNSIIFLIETSNINNKGNSCKEKDANCGLEKNVILFINSDGFDEFDDFGKMYEPESNIEKFLLDPMLLISNGLDEL